MSDHAPDFSPDRKYQDTWHVAVGAQYRFHPAWVVSTGFAYDSSMVKDKHRTLDAPVGETYKFGLGDLWQAKPPLNLGFSYRLAWGVICLLIKIGGHWPVVWPANLRTPRSTFFADRDLGGRGTDRAKGNIVSPLFREA